MRDAIKTFLETWAKNGEPEIYNERSLQFELGAYLKENFGQNCKIYYEKDIYEYIKGKFSKHYPDILIVDNSKKYLVELKFLPEKANKKYGYPKRFFELLEDISFVSQLRVLDQPYFAEVLSVTVAADKKFFSKPNRSERIESYNTNLKPRGEIFNKNYPKIQLENTSTYYETKKGTKKKVTIEPFAIQWEKLANDFEYYIF